MNENPSNHTRLMDLEIGESLYKATLRSSSGTPVTKVELQGGGVGITYTVNESHRQGRDCARLDERTEAEASWLNGWTLYDTQAEASEAADARVAQMSSMERDVMRYGSH